MYQITQGETLCSSLIPCQKFNFSGMVTYVNPPIAKNVQNLMVWVN